jgi:hypothetical protein
LLSPGSFDASIPSFSRLSDASDTSMFEIADWTFAEFSLNQARAFSGNFWNHPASLCPFKPQKLHITPKLPLLVLPSLLQLL